MLPAGSPRFLGSTVAEERPRAAAAPGPQPVVVYTEACKHRLKAGEIIAARAGLGECGGQVYLKTDETRACTNLEHSSRTFRCVKNRNACTQKTVNALFCAALVS
jgi:hypothetical protein